ncbi:MAG TPA: GNAT family N-acetyltransferase [Acidimicrobiia bacterium]|nr:GNAT family N-acetyltransferase [Acidimicrobiia bacterium]
MSYSYRAIDDESDPARQTVRDLIGSAFGGALGPSYWDWKFHGDARHPLVFVAESGGEVVGCRHSLVFDLRLEAGLEVPVLIGGDLLVRPEHRGHHVARRLAAGALDLSIQRNPEVAAYAAFTWPGLADHLTRPLVGTVPVPSSTRRWSKIVGWDNRIANLSSSGLLDDAGQNRGVAGGDHTMRMEIEGAPPLWVEIRGGRVALSGAQPASHEVRVRLRRDGIEALRSRSPVRILRAVSNGGIRVRGRPRHLREVLGARRFYTRVLQELLKKPSPSSR